MGLGGTCALPANGRACPPQAATNGRPRAASGLPQRCPAARPRLNPRRADAAAPAPPASCAAPRSPPRAPRMRTAQLLHGACAQPSRPGAGSRAGRERAAAPGPVRQRRARGAPRGRGETACGRARTGGGRGAPVCAAGQARRVNWYLPPLVPLRERGGRGRGPGSSFCSSSRFRATVQTSTERNPARSRGGKYPKTKQLCQVMATDQNAKKEIRKVRLRSQFSGGAKWMTWCLRENQSQATPEPELLVWYFSLNWTSPLKFLVKLENYTSAYAETSPGSEHTT